MYLNEQKLHKEMVNVVKSEEAKQVFEAGLKNLDANALTEKGIIKSYTIDYESIEHNPMGGINVTILANNDKDLYVFFTLSKSAEGTLTDGVGGNSLKLETLLEKNQNDI